MGVPVIPYHFVPVYTYVNLMLICYQHKENQISFYFKQIYTVLLDEKRVLQVSYSIKIGNPCVYRKMLYRNDNVFFTMLYAFSKY